MKIGGVIVLAVCLPCACGASIRVVTASPQGGEIALIGSRDSAMEKARAEMAQKCGGATSYEVVEEGEVVIAADGAATSTFEVGHDTKGAREWRVKYTCGAPDASAATD